MGDLVTLFFVVLPLSTLIDLLGSVFFVKVFRGNVNKIVIGTGKTILKLKKFEVRTVFFWGGEYSYTNLKINNKFSKILICLGGILFTAISALSLFCMLVLQLLPSVYLTNSLVGILVFLSIYNIIPITFGGSDTKAKQILQLLKKEKHANMLKDEKNHQAIIAQIDAEIARLKKASETTPYQFMKIKYIRELDYKSQIQKEMGRIKDSIITQKEIYSEISNYPSNIQIVYYNNLLYDCITSDCTDDTDEIYSKLIELLSMEENKIYENDSIRDTIETYKLYKSALQ